MNKTYSPADIRNFAVVGHASSGKTMLCQSMLACAGVINRLGTIDAGSTVSDFHDDEQERKISIHTSLMHCEWLGKKFNIVDTPGYLDFISEGLGALRVGDFALVVIHANHGPGVGTDQVWKYATQFDIPKMICVTAADKEHADPEVILAQLRSRYGAKVFPLNVALNGAEPAAYIFKTMSEAQFGELSFFRVYSGRLHAGMDLYNADRKCTERVGQIYILNGKTRTAAADLGPGDIGATVKLKDTHTGNTLCSPKRILTLPKVKYPTPNIHVALKLKTKGEEEKMASGLAALHEEDPTFLFHVDSELHQTVISGQGELHLRVVAERLKHRFKVDFEMIEPRIPYRETIHAPADSKYRHKKQTGGAGQFAEVWMKIEPKERNAGVEFTQSLSGQNVDRTFVPSVEKGVNSACTEGVIAGYRVVDVMIDFYDGKMHPVDSKDIAFQIAGKAAFKEAFLKARPCLLEPIYEIEVRAPEDCLGAVMGDLSSRRGRIMGTDSADGYSIVKATVPQKELYKYASVLRSLTGGRGIHTEAFSHYTEMPREHEQAVIAEHSKKHEPEA